MLCLGGGLLRLAMSDKVAQLVREGRMWLRSGGQEGAHRRPVLGGHSWRLAGRWARGPSLAWPLARALPALNSKVDLQ